MYPLEAFPVLFAHQNPSFLAQRFCFRAVAFVSAFLLLISWNAQDWETYLDKIFNHSYYESSNSSQLSGEVSDLESSVPSKFYLLPSVWDDSSENFSNFSSTSCHCNLFLSILHFSPVALIAPLLLHKYSEAPRAPPSPSL